MESYVVDSSYFTHNESVCDRLDYVSKLNANSLDKLSFDCLNKWFKNYLFCTFECDFVCNDDFLLTDDYELKLYLFFVGDYLKSFILSLGIKFTNVDEIINYLNKSFVQDKLCLFQKSEESELNIVEERCDLLNSIDYKSLKYFIVESLPENFALVTMNTFFILQSVLLSNFEVIESNIFDEYYEVFYDYHQVPTDFFNFAIQSDYHFRVSDILVKENQFNFSRKLFFDYFPYNSLFLGVSFDSTIHLLENNVLRLNFSKRLREFIKIFHLRINLKEVFKLKRSNLLKIQRSNVININLLNFKFRKKILIEFHCVEYLILNFKFRKKLCLIAYYGIYFFILNLNIKKVSFCFSLVNLIILILQKMIHLIKYCLTFNSFKIYS